jgi:midasin (ATPase involved in ribosome maturation)
MFNKIDDKPQEIDKVDSIELIIKGAIIESIVNNSDELINGVETMIKDRLMERFGNLPEKVLTIKKDLTSKTVTSITHKKFEDVLKCVAADNPVFLVSPAGAGKNHMVKEIADALELDFYFSNAITQEYKVTGFIDANGVYQETEFYKAFTKGGLFFLDELDASIPEVLVILNAAIENRYFDFPNGKVYAHENFRVIAAGNTYGNGADLQYVGRYKLDEASMDRFAMIYMSYDERIEMVLCDNNKPLIAFIHKLRDTLTEQGVSKIISYRAIRQITAMEKLNLPLQDIMRYSIIRGMERDGINMVKNHMAMSNNKYFDAFTKAVDDIGKFV